MNEPTESLDAMLSALDPAAHLTDTAIDELFPFARLDMSIDAALLTTSPMPHARRRRAVVAAGVVACLAMAAIVAVSVRPNGARTPSTVVVRARPISFAGGTLPVTEKVGAPVPYAPAYVWFGGSVSWCSPRQLTGTLAARIGTAATGSSGVLSIVNHGGSCEIADVAGNVVAISATGHPIGHLLAPRQVARTALELHHGGGATLTVSFASTSLYRNSVCRPRAVRGFDLVGGTLGWPSWQFTLPESLSVCEGVVSNFLSSALSPENLP